jgi:hypothetical protein
MAVSAWMQALIDKIDAADAAHFSELRELAKRQSAHAPRFRKRSATTSAWLAPPSGPQEELHRRLTPAKLAAAPIRLSAGGGVYTDTASCGPSG